jgi:hypothetical protein
MMKSVKMPTKAMMGWTSPCLLAHPHNAGTREWLGRVHIGPRGYRCGWPLFPPLAANKERPLKRSVEELKLRMLVLVDELKECALATGMEDNNALLKHLERLLDATRAFRDDLILNELNGPGNDNRE